MPVINLQRRRHRGAGRAAEAVVMPGRAGGENRVSGAHWASRYWYPLALPALTAVLDWFAGGYMYRPPFVLYVPAVVVSGVYGGFLPGALATTVSALSALAVAHLHPAPAGTGLGLLPPTAVFLSVGLTVSSVAHALHQAVRGQRGSDRLFRLIVSGVRDYAIFLLDPRGRVATWNAGAQRIKGWEAGEIVGRHFSAFYPPEDVAAGKPARVLEEAARAGRVEDEGWRVRKDGSRFWASVLITAVKDENGRLLGFSKVTRDLSERKAAETQARESYLRTIIDAQEALISYVDMEQRYAFNNRAYEDWFGTPAASIKGRTMRAVLGEEAYARIRGRVERALAGERVRYEEEMPYRSGGTRWISAQYVPHFDGEGRQLGFFVYVIDITARRRAEEKLEEAVDERTEALRRTVEELESFSYTVSHDLRAPLRAVQGYAHFIEERSRGSLDPASRRMLGRVADSATRMDRLIQDLLVYGRLSRGDYKMYPLDAEPVVDHVVSHYPELAAARVAVRRPLGRVVGQDSLLTQAVANLLVNAAKFVPPGRTPEIEVRAEESGAGRVRLVVEDNGIGISPEAGARLFRPFQRLDPGARYEGTGIGLAIVKRAAERMGGRVGLESEPGKGSRFWVELPRP